MPQLNEILRKEALLQGSVTLFELYSPEIAEKVKAGQFVVVRTDEYGERIPLTVAGHDPHTGSITIIFQEVGLSTKKLGRFNRGEVIADVVGPLGLPSNIRRLGTVVCVGGGVGVAVVYPVAKAFKEAGNEVVSIIGARSKDLLILEDEMRAVSDELLVTTDDGSYGHHGFVTDVLKRLIDEGRKIDEVTAIGPAVMMRAVTDVTREPGIHTIVSLNTLMVDGTGMCGCCRITVGGKTKFVCVDGPEFDGHKVDFEELLNRSAIYHREERRAEWDHKCRVEAAANALKRQKSRTPMPKQHPMRRARNFDEVALGYTETQAIIEANRCLNCKTSPCIAGCPVEIDIPAFIALIREGDFMGAIHKIKEKNSLPAICGRVCPQEDQCEINCVLSKKGQPIAIGRLERFVADYEAAQGEIKPPPLAAPSGKRVAVIGAGPAGLTVAGELVKLGHQVTVFEALHKAGGVLVYGIPEFRLPKAVVQQECNYIGKMGADIRLSFVVGKSKTLDELMKDGYDAVFVGTGAGLPYFMNIPGENLNGVYSANEFLTRVNLMKAYRFPEYDTPIHLGRRIAVVGGGNVAMDSARISLRLGAEKVYLVYRRAREQMPAREEEIVNAFEEGVIPMLLTNPVKILGNQKGWVDGMECIKMELGTPDASGRRRPIPIEDSGHVIDVDMVIIAIGQGPNPLLTQTTPDLETNRWGNISADEETGQTSKRGVFAGGDIVTGAATVILAMGAGKKAAAAIDKHLGA
ncbi:MAG: NADPH-dependent glutamate synthase [Candidatus Eisenbacteria sp.]|nr:NADPH-dependent glutamate synthase [Candidatus Eisenbacteria bacterium]